MASVNRNIESARQRWNRHQFLIESAPCPPYAFIGSATPEGDWDEADVTSADVDRERKRLAPRQDWQEENLRLRILNLRMCCKHRSGCRWLRVLGQSKGCWAVLNNPMHLEDLAQQRSKEGIDAWLKSHFVNRLVSLQVDW